MEHDFQSRRGGPRTSTGLRSCTSEFWLLDCRPVLTTIVRPVGGHFGGQIADRSRPGFCHAQRPKQLC
jgi:hypothetical protein